ncbi:hypothetical protein GBA52_014500 [Prunus armeniaca]|nr:hypothetical protein GBA52_014500 [Prunus armeniaca]
MAYILEIVAYWLKQGVHQFCFTSKSPYHETINFDKSDHWMFNGFMQSICTLAGADSKIGGSPFQYPI